MKRLVLVGTLAAALSAPAAFAQPPAGQTSGAGQAAGADKKSQPTRPARRASGAPGEQAGHTAPKPQPNTGPAPTAPEGQVALGTVRIPKPVKANGQSLPAGTYQVRLTPQTASPDAKGQTASLERWVEFVQRGQVKGREVVTIIPQAEISQVQKDAPPRPNASKVETLKGGDYVRLWINKAGNHYLVHFPA